jgi:hypothetical protein
MSEHRVTCNHSHLQTELTDVPERNDWIALALLWLDVGAAAIEHAERVYGYSLLERSARYERAREALVQRSREEKHMLRTEHAVLAKLHAVREAW